MRSKRALAFSSLLLAAALAVACGDLSLAGLEPVPENGVVFGDGFDYHIVLPQGWYMKKSTEFNREFVLPGKNAEVAVLGFREPEGTSFSINTFMRAMEDEANKLFSDVRMVEKNNLQSRGVVGRMWHATAVDEGVPVHVYCAFYVRYEQAFAIIATAPEEVFEELRPDLDRVIRSFELRTI